MQLPKPRDAVHKAWLYRLLRTRPEWKAHVEAIAPPLVDGLEASLLMLPVANDRILFLADEDPVFEEISITLLRVVDAAQFEAARDSIVTSLYGTFMQP